MDCYRKASWMESVKAAIARYEAKPSTHRSRMPRPLTFVLEELKRRHYQDATAFRAA